MAPSPGGEPSLQGWALGGIQPSQSCKLLLRVRVVLLVEQALDDEHSCEREEGIELECLACLAQRDGPVLTLE